MVDIDVAFRSLDEWVAWTKENPYVFDSAYADAVGTRILSKGLVEPLTNFTCGPDDIPHSGKEWREGLAYQGVNSRGRAVLKLIAEFLIGRSAYDVTLFATEAITPLALRLRGIYPRFLGSEYGADEAARQALYPIPHQDLMALDLASGKFDLITTNEVLEHVPDLDASLREMARVLKPGGWHVGTHPFRFLNKDSERRAVIRDGEVVHLMPAEYHGNPIDPARGSLVFELPGWDIIERAKAAGFKDAFMRFVASEKHGILTENTGVFVFCAMASDTPPSVKVAPDANTTAG